MPDLHWSEWMWLGMAGFMTAVFAAKLLLLHRGLRHPETPVKLGSLTEDAPRRRSAPIEVAAGQRCPCCHGDLAVSEGLHRCPGCSTMLHWECHREFGCPTLGCDGGFGARGIAAPAQPKASAKADGKAAPADGDEPPRIVIKETA